MNTGLPGHCNKGIPIPRVLCHNLTEVTQVPGKGMGILYKLQNIHIRVRKCHRTHRSSGYCDTGVHNSQTFRAGTKPLQPYPGYLWHGRIELTKVPAMSYRTYRSSGYVIQNVQKFRARVYMSHRTYKSSLWGNTRGKYPGHCSASTPQNTILKYSDQRQLNRVKDSQTQLNHGGGYRA